MRRLLAFFSFIVLVSVAFPALAHHVLGRPAYSLNEDSNTPPTMQIETTIGDYFVTMMAFPAFPKPNESTRINLYAVHEKSDKPYLGQVSFSVQDDGFFAEEEELIGVQKPDDNVFRQSMVFSKEGDYLVSAQFEADGQPYRVDFPIRIGNPLPIVPISAAAGVVVLVLAAVALHKRTGRNRRRLLKDEKTGIMQ